MLPMQSHMLPRRPAVIMHSTNAHSETVHLSLLSLGDCSGKLVPLLSRWSIKQQFIAREEYKSAVERLTAEKFSEPSRRAMDRLLTSMTDSIAEVTMK